MKPQPLAIFLSQNARIYPPRLILLLRKLEIDKKAGAHMLRHLCALGAIAGVFGPILAAWMGKFFKKKSLLFMELRHRRRAIVYRLVAWLAKKSSLMS